MKKQKNLHFILAAMLSIFLLMTGICAQAISSADVTVNIDNEDFETGGVPREANLIVSDKALLTYSLTGGIIEEAYSNESSGYFKIYGTCKEGETITLDVAAYTYNKIGSQDMTNENWFSVETNNGLEKKDNTVSNFSGSISDGLSIVVPVGVKEIALFATTATRPAIATNAYKTRSVSVKLTVIEKKTMTLQIGSKTLDANGKIITLDSPPVLLDDRTLLPIRAVVEALDGTVGWDGGEQKITIKKDNTIIEMWLNKTTIRVNGAEKTIDVAPTTINDRTMVPVRFVAENIPECSVEWNDETQSVMIRY